VSDIPDPQPPIPFPNPLDNLGAQSLFDTTLLLQIACGRNKGVLRNKHRKKLCYLASLLQIQAANKGQPTPQRPYKL
jgi:hypothetical protein